MGKSHVIAIAGRKESTARSADTQRQFGILVEFQGKLMSTFEFVVVVEDTYLR